MAPAAMTGISQLERDLPAGTFVVALTPSWWGKMLALLLICTILLVAVQLVLSQRNYSTLIDNRANYCAQEALNGHPLTSLCASTLGR